MSDKPLNRNISGDGSGIMDLPFKLMIMMILIGTTVPASMIGYRNISRTRYDSKVNGELMDLASMAQRLSREGNLSRCRLEMDIEGDPFARLDYVNIGENLDQHNNILRYKFSWKKGQESMVVTGPEVKLTSPYNSTQKLDGNEHELYLTHVVLKGRSFVVVSKNSRDIDIDNFS